VNDDNRVDLRERRATKIPVGWIAFFGVAENPGAVLAGYALLKLHWKGAPDLRRNTECLEAVGRKGDIHGYGGLELFSGWQRGPRTRGRNFRHKRAQPSTAVYGVVDL
jgi:hypothetical protein